MAILKLEIETETEEGIYPLLQHVFREITEANYTNHDIEYNAAPSDGWLRIDSQKFKGAYRWAKE